MVHFYEFWYNSTHDVIFCIVSILGQSNRMALGTIEVKTWTLSSLTAYGEVMCFLSAEVNTLSSDIFSAVAKIHIVRQLCKTNAQKQYQAIRRDMQVFAAQCLSQSLYSSNFVVGSCS